MTIVDTSTPTTQIGAYAYDGDGVRVKAVEGTLTRYFVGDHYELAGTSVRKYYSIGGARVAELRYYPYGSYRYNTGG